MHFDSYLELSTTQVYSGYPKNFSLVFCQCHSRPWIGELKPFQTPCGLAPGWPG